MGYLTNILNPKATLFMLALFTQVISPDTILGVKALLGVEMAFSTFLWFAFVATVLTHKSINKHFRGVKHYFEKVFGAILVGLGIKVALGTHK
jgi:threonine/homoserine/homoserine lactone efflux protein